LIFLAAFPGITLGAYASFSCQTLVIFKKEIAASFLLSPVSCARNPTSSQAPPSPAVPLGQEV
jgi:hypothetical protein